MPLISDSQDFDHLINDLKKNFNEPFLYVYFSGESSCACRSMGLYVDYFNDNSIIKKIIKKEGRKNLLPEIEIVVTRNFLENDEMSKLLVAARFVFIFGFYETTTINKIEAASKRWSFYSKMGKKRWRDFSENFFFIDVEHGSWGVLGSGQR